MLESINESYKKFLKKSQKESPKESWEKYLKGSLMEKIRESPKESHKNSGIIGNSFQNYNRNNKLEKNQLLG